MLTAALPDVLCVLPQGEARCAQLPNTSQPCPMNSHALFPGSPSPCSSYSLWCFPRCLTPTSLLRLLPTVLKQESHTERDRYLHGAPVPGQGHLFCSTPTPSCRQRTRTHGGVAHLPQPGRGRGGHGWVLPRRAKSLLLVAGCPACEHRGTQGWGGVGT